MKRRYNHETNQWDIVLREQDYYQMMNELDCLRGIISRNIKEAPYMSQVIGQPCYPPFFAKQLPIDNYKLPDGADLAGVDMVAHNEQIDTFRFRGFN